VGATQWLAAMRTPPHLVTIVPANTSSDYYQNWTYEDGVFRLAFIEPWMMDTIALTAARQRGDLETAAELTEVASNAASWEHYRPYATFPPLHPEDPSVAPYFFDAIRHPTYDEYWKRWSIRGHYDQVTVPVLHFEGWYDAFLAGGVENFTGMVDHGATAAARAGQRIVIGPWDHLGWGRPDSIEAPMLKNIGPVANSPINELMRSDFPQFAPNPNTGQPFGTDTTWQPADQTIYTIPATRRRCCCRSCRPTIQPCTPQPPSRWANSASAARDRLRGWLEVLAGAAGSGFCLRHSGLHAGGDGAGG
jgi:predicted acyl esterase